MYIKFTLLGDGGVGGGVIGGMAAELATATRDSVSGLFKSSEYF